MEMTNAELLNKYRRLGLVEATSGSVTVGGKEFSRNDGYVRRFYNINTGRYDVFRRSGFVKMYTGEGKDVSDVVKNFSDLGRIHKLLTSIDDGNMIMHKNHKSAKAVPTNRKLLVKMIDMSDDRGGRFISKMIKLGVIKKAKIEDTERYFVNPVYTMASTGISLTLYKLFREELIPHLTEQAVDDLDFLVYHDMHPELLEEALEEERVVQEKENEFFEAEIEQMAIRSAKSAVEHKQANTQETSSNKDNKRQLELLKKWTKRIDASYTGADDEDVSEVIDETMDALLEYFDSKRTEEDKQTLMKTKAGNYIAFNSQEIGPLTIYLDTEDKKRLQTGTVHSL